jgi:hypothetical protein
MEVLKMPSVIIYGAEPEIVSIGELIAEVDRNVRRAFGESMNFIHYCETTNNRTVLVEVSCLGTLSDQVADSLNNALMELFISSYKNSRILIRRV